MVILYTGRWRQNLWEWQRVWERCSESKRRMKTTYSHMSSDSDMETHSVQFHVWRPKPLYTEIFSSTLAADETPCRKECLLICKNFVPDITCIVGRNKINYSNFNKKSPKVLYLWCTGAYLGYLFFYFEWMMS